MSGSLLLVCCVKFVVLVYLRASFEDFFQWELISKIYENVCHNHDLSRPCFVTTITWEIVVVNLMYGESRPIDNMNVLSGQINVFWLIAP